MWPVEVTVPHAEGQLELEFHVWFPPRFLSVPHCLHRAPLMTWVLEIGSSS